MKRWIAMPIVLLAIIFASVSIIAQTKNANERIPLHPNVKVGKLSNGMTYYIMENKKPENRVEAWIKFKVGSVQEEENQRGLAHFIEHMCFNGTKNFPKDSLIKFLESMGVKFGADINAHTAFDEITYTLTLPTDVPGMVEKGMQVLEDWAMNVSFDAEEIEKERGVILAEELSRLANAEGRMTNIHIPKMLAGSKYANRMPIGLTEVIKTAPREAFLDYYYGWFRPELTAVIVVGDIKVAEIEELVKKHFSGWKYQGKGTPKPRTYEKIPNNAAPIVSIAADKELPYATAMFMIKHPERNNLTYNSYREGIKEGLFSTMFNMRFQEILQEPNPPFLAAGGQISDFFGGVRTFTLYAVPTQDNFTRAVERAWNETFRIDQHGFTASEFERAKETLLSLYERSYNERDKTENAALAGELAGYFEEKECMPGIEVEYQLVKEYLPTITLAEVNKMVSEQVTRENIICQISLPESATKPTEQEIVGIITKAETTKHEAYVDELGDAKLMKDLPKPGKITASKQLPNFEITEMVLSNGARVLLKPTNFKNDQILFNCYAAGGTSLYSDAEFQLASNAAGIVDNCGLGEFTSVKLSKLLQSKVIRLSPYISSYEQGMNGSTTPKDKEIFFQLLNMQFTQPRKDNDAFTSWKTRMDDILRGRRNDPMSDFQDTMQVVMAGYNPRGNTLTRDDVEKFNLDRAFNIYKERFADASNFTFVFVGAFQVDELKPLIEQYIASLPATNKKEKANDLKMRPVPGIVNKVVHRGIEPKSAVCLIIDSDNNNYSSEELLKVSMMKEIMSIKILENLREDKGGVYSPYGGAYMGYFPRKFVRAQIFFECDPNRTEELINAAKEVFDNAQNAVSTEDLAKAKELTKKEYEVQSKENNFWLRTITSYEQTGRGNAGMSFLKDYPKNVDKITQKDLVDIAKKSLNYKQNCISIVQMPEED